MITPQLERWILNGTASVSIHSHALSMAGRIPCGKGKLAIITKIIWYPFVNPVRPVSLATMTYAEFFRYCEYALKIESASNTVIYNFRNNLKMSYASAGTIPMTNVVNAAGVGAWAILPGDPIILDTFICCTGSIKLAISRNAMLDSFPTNNNGTLAKTANQAAAPDGIGSNSLLRQIQMQAIGGRNFYYEPPSSEFSGVTPPAGTQRDIQTYVHDIQEEAASNFGSGFSTVGDVNHWPLNQPTITHPLVNFEVVYVNKEIADKLQST
jgi:hypothetical protein